MSFGARRWKKEPEAYGEEVPDVPEVAEVSLMAEEKPLDVVELKGIATSGETVEGDFLRFPLRRVFDLGAFVVVEEDSGWCCEMADEEGTEALESVAESQEEVGETEVSSSCSGSDGRSAEGCEVSCE